MQLNEDNVYGLQLCGRYHIYAEDRRLTGNLHPEEFVAKSNASRQLLLLPSIGFSSVLEECMKDFLEINSERPVW